MVLFEYNNENKIKGSRQTSQEPRTARRKKREMSRDPGLSIIIAKVVSLDETTFVDH